MATEFEVLMPATYGREETEIALQALEHVQKIEQVLSIYKPRSLVSQLNLSGTDGMKVPEDLFQLLSEACTYSEQTSGAFDITAGPLVDAWGFTERSGRKPTDEQLQEVLDCVGYRWIALDSEKQTVRLTRPGMRINLGAIGKGYALDYVRAHLVTAGVENFLTHGGNSSLVARGSRRPGEPGWPVALSHPLQAKRRLGRVWVQDGSLSTSGSGKQFFHHQGKRMGHVIDPRTGYPGGEFLSLSLLAPGAAQTDALATGLFVQEESERNEFLIKHPNCAIIAVCPGRRDSEVEVLSTSQSWEPFSD